MSASLAPGVVVSRYRILEPLGKGGMGEVYKAWDPTLERAIALKILPPELVRNPDRVRRFVQEAKSASSLNHPHIVTIHDVGEARLPLGGEESIDIQYIAMELIEGETLRRKISEGADLRALVGWLAQASDGIAKAHSAGIVHRDLKPDNIMISRDGFAKVLDFGLAKLIERNDPMAAPNDKTDVRRDDSEGMLVGTIGYMSPEQILGRPVDHRSDIFSFGAILYEAATKRKPFAADSNVDVMHKIVHDKPEPIDKFNSSAPAELRRAIRRCLAKEPDARYHSMKDLAIELRELFDEWDELSTTSDSRVSSDAHERPTVIMQRAGVRRGAILPVMLALAVIVLAAGGFLAWRNFAKPAPPQFRLDTLKITRLTNGGNVVLASISPDGKYLAFETRDGATGNFALSLQQIATGSNVAVVAPQPSQIVGFSFSPDSNYLYYAARENSLSEYNWLYAVPTLGGTARKVLYDIDSGVTFSPDGKRIAAFRGIPQRNEGDLIVANADGSGARVLATAAGIERLDYVTPAWSPDGKQIAGFIASTRGGTHGELALFDAGSGTRQRLGTQVWYAWTDKIVWAPDGSGIYTTAAPVPTGGLENQIWFVSVPSAVATRVFTDTNFYSTIAITADGRTIVSVQMNVTGDVATSKPDGTEASILTSPDQIVQSVGAAGDHIVYCAYANDTGNLWLLDGKGAKQQLTTLGHSQLPDASRDGKTIAYRCWRNNTWKPCVMNVDSGTERTIEGVSNFTPVAITPDGHAILYRDEKSDMIFAPLGGGPSKVLAHDSGSVAVSRDGTRVAIGVIQNAGGKEHPRLLIIDLASGSILKTLEWFQERRFRWMPADAGVAYFSSVTPRDLFVQPLDGSAPKQLTHYDSGDIFDFDFLPDGRLVVARGEVRNNAVMITDFK
ncbi:MAG TPA: protein kinase [Thermoanaerobaculia bacterium]|jgi:serine/threonine protein kinase|nr:protein kinase [Thermoanaerobaculia bacterium]